MRVNTLDLCRNQSLVDSGWTLRFDEQRIFVWKFWLAPRAIMEEQYAEDPYGYQVAGQELLGCTDALGTVP